MWNFEVKPTAWTEPVGRILEKSESHQKLLFSSVTSTLAVSLGGEHFLWLSTDDFAAG